MKSLIQQKVGLYEVKPIQGRHFDTVFHMESDYGERPTWDINRIHDICNDPLTIKIVLLKFTKVVGSSIAIVGEEDLEVQRFTIAEDERRNGAGTAMLTYLDLVSREKRRRNLTFTVRETNDRALRFLLNRNFKPKLIPTPEQYKSLNEDGFKMSRQTVFYPLSNQLVHTPPPG